MEQKRILIIDDESTFTRMVRINLEQTKRYVVREENRAMHALTTAHEFKPDLILLDVIMPGADGGEIASRIRADHALKHVPVVFLTATVSRQEAAEGKFTGGYLFLAKPVSLKALVECMENLLAAKKHEHAPAEVKKPAA
jgi:CheY-like chemotaxis protein